MKFTFGVKAVCEAVFGSTKGASVVDLVVIVLFDDIFDTDRFTTTARRVFFDTLLSNLDESTEPTKVQKDIDKMESRRLKST